MTTTIPPPAAETGAAIVSLDSAESREGLARNTITLPGVLFIAIAVMAPGAGAAFAIIGGAPYAGGALPAAVVMALIGSLLVSVGIGQLAKHLPSAGGLSTYIGKAFHPGAGFVAAWAYPFVFLAAIPYLALIFGNLLATAIEPSGTGTAFHILWIVGALALLVGAFAMNYFGIQFGARTGLILGLTEIGVLVVISIWMIIQAGGHNTLSVFTPHQANVKGFTGSSGIIAGSIYGFLAFVGFEAAAPVAEETKDPKRNIPRAVLGSCLLVGLLYTLTTYASTVFYGPGRMSGFLNYGGGDPWIALAKVVWGGGWIILLITLLNSSLACANGSFIAATRTLWSMGKSGTMPRGLARTHPRWKSPVVALGVMFGLGLIGTFWIGEQYSPVAAYSLFGTVLTVAILPIYLGAALACPVYFLRYRRREVNWLIHVVLPVLGMAFLVPAFFTGAGIKVFSFVAPLTYPVSLAGPIVGVWYAIGIGLMVYLLVLRPHRIKAEASEPAVALEARPGLVLLDADVAGG